MYNLNQLKKLNASVKSKTNTIKDAIYDVYFELKAIKKNFKEVPHILIFHQFLPFDRIANYSTETILFSEKKLTDDDIIRIGSFIAAKEKRTEVTPPDIYRGARKVVDAYNSWLEAQLKRIKQEYTIKPKKF